MRQRPVREDLVRAAVLEIYGSVRTEGFLADRAIDRVLRRETRLYSAERRAVAETVWSLLRQERRLDRALFGGAAPRLAPFDLFALRYAALRVAEGEDPNAIARGHGVSPQFAPALARAAQPLPDAMSLLERVAIEGSLPDAIAQRLIDDLGADEALAFVRALGERAPLTIRANTLKTDRTALAARLETENVPSAPTRFSPIGLNLETRVNAFGLASFQDGLFELQDEGSQLLAHIVQAAPGERVVDACAGAGGKTLALAAQMRNRGELWALDVEAGRLEELSRRARRAGVHNLRIQAIPKDSTADAALAPLAGRADRVLIDAPCTGLGAIRRNPDARYRLKPEDFPAFAARQLELLHRFSALVRPGGRVVYATCSVAREEDDRVVEAFYAAKPAFRLVPVAGLLPPECASLADGPYLRLLPNRHGTDGFFAAVLERVG